MTQVQVLETLYEKKGTAAESKIRKEKSRRIRKDKPVKSAKI